MMKGVGGNVIDYLSFAALQRVVSRREAFVGAFWAGLAAPAMLFAAPVSYVLYDGNAGLQQAWADVGAQMTRAMSRTDEPSE